MVVVWECNPKRVQDASALSQRRYTHTYTFRLECVPASLRVAPVERTREGYQRTSVLLLLAVHCSRTPNLILLCVACSVQTKCVSPPVAPIRRPESAPVLWAESFSQAQF